LSSKRGFVTIGPATVGVTAKKKPPVFDTFFYTIWLKFSVRAPHKS